MLRLKLIVGPDYFEVEGAVPLAEVLPLIHDWLAVISFTTDREWPARVTQALDHLLTQVSALQAQGRVFQMTADAMTAALDKIDTATNNIAADLARLKAQIGTGMSQADVDAVQARLDQTVSTLEGIAADTEDPVPESGSTTT